MSAELSGDGGPSVVFGLDEDELISAIGDVLHGAPDDHEIGDLIEDAERDEWREQYARAMDDVPGVECSVCHGVFDYDDGFSVGGFVDEEGRRLNADWVCFDCAPAEDADPESLDELSAEDGIDWRAVAEAQLLDEALRPLDEFGSQTDDWLDDELADEVEGHGPQGPLGDPSTFGRADGGDDALAGEVDPEWDLDDDPGAPPVEEALSDHLYWASVSIVVEDLFGMSFDSDRYLLQSYIDNLAPEEEDALWSEMDARYGGGSEEEF